MSEIKDQILQKIIEVTLVDTTGHLQIIGENVHQYHKYLNLLKAELLDDKTFLGKMDDIRYYIPSSSHFFNDGGIGKIILQMKSDENYSFDNFTRILYEKMDLIKKENKPEKFELYYSINIEPLDLVINKITVRDIVIEILNHKDIREVFEDEKFKAEKVDKGFNESDFQYIRVTLWGRNLEYVFQKSLKYVQLILGFISYSKNYHRETISLFGTPKPLIELEFGYIFAFKESEYLNYAVDTDKNLSKKSYKIEELDITNLTIILEAFGKMKDNIQEIICNSMGHYYEGLIEKNVKQSFLNFWMVVEILTLKDKDLPHYKVVERWKSLVVLDAFVEYKIDRLYDLRNKLVHNGNTARINEIDRNMMKDNAELLVHFFIFTLSTFRISEINTLYMFLGQDVDSLIKSKEMIDQTIKLKTKGD